MTLSGIIRIIFQSRFSRPKGVLLYNSVQEVILNQRRLAKEGFSVRLVAPPPEFRLGCDLAIEFELIEQEAIESRLRSCGTLPVRIVSSKEMLPDVLKRSQIIRFPDHIMAKAGNMKVTVDKQQHRIVNVSGGGCPDIPHVAHRLHGVTIETAPDPISLGNSLCSYMLQIAFDALKKELRLS